MAANVQRRTADTVFIGRNFSSVHNQMTLEIIMKGMVGLINSTFHVLDDSHKSDCITICI